MNHPDQRASTPHGLIEVHTLHSMPANCLNRDDRGFPKDLNFGGEERDRISSQCWKRAERRHPVFNEMVGQEPGIRTRYLLRALHRRLAHLPETERALVLPACVAALAGPMDKAGRTSALLYLGQDELAMMAVQLEEAWDMLCAELSAQASQAAQADDSAAAADARPARAGRKKKAADEGPSTLALVTQALRRDMSDGVRQADVALFGRFVADAPGMTIDAAVQTSHAFTTHARNLQTDYYTAVDDLAAGDDPAAAMLGYIPFTSGCYYRYHCVDVAQLVANLREDVDLAARAVRAFLYAAVVAVPGARQATMAAHVAPGFVLGVARTDRMPWMLSDAFEAAIQPRPGEGLMAPSVHALDEYWALLDRTYPLRASETRRPALLFQRPGLERCAPALAQYRADTIQGWIADLTGALAVFASAPEAA